ncbi:MULTISPECIES: TlpA disulfide reductase family protein [Bacteroides]|uniref:TlpA disulfide reductase family protein n=1 Tax=Bacteroides TaxID=816 RepID=UPI001CB858F6|nr:MULTISPECIES: TlpA disulfide reductase family protein [Bacteroides]
MRNRIMILCTFCVIAIFSSAQEKFSIRGIANEELNNQLLYLCLMEDGEKAKEVVWDSTTVEKGKFSFSGVHQMPDIAIIKDMDGETYPLILEKGKISVNIAANKRGGTPLNDSLNIALNRMQLIMDNMNQTAKAIYDLVLGVKSEVFIDKIMNDTAFKAKRDRMEKIFFSQIDSVSHCIKDYKNTIVGVYLFTVGGIMMPFDDMKALMEEASPMFSQNNLVKNVVEKKKQAELRIKAEVEKTMSKEQMEEQKKRQDMDAKIKIGERFLDAKVKDNIGNTKLLSDYVGKGKYVLIDFWASWCGPCRHEMPNVRAAYEKYASKGFEVISISTDRKLKPWRAAIEELGMNWVQLLDVDASDIYGIYAIPKTFLVDPTGIVIDRNLRGEKLEEALSKLFE